MTDTKYIGIDFGTTNCCVAYTHLHPRQNQLIEPQIVEVNNHPTVQNTLAFKPDHRTLLAIGEDVYESRVYLQHPDCVVRDYKLHLDDPQIREYAGVMFQELHHSLLRTLNVKRLIPEQHQVVIGVPAHWSAQENRNILAAAALGGFGNVSPVPEPLGAMLYHVYTGEIRFEEQPEYDLVIDFGGGTTDFVVLQMSRDLQTPRIVQVYGDRLGGHDFDLVIMKFLRQRFYRGQNWSPRLDLQLEMFARRFKERFSTALARGAQTYEQMCGLQRFDSMVGLTRAEFENEDVGGPLLTRFAALLEGGLQSCQMDPLSFRRIILSGGSSRWYFVQDILHQYFKNAVIVRSTLPEQTIAKGLSLYLADPRQMLSKSSALSGIPQVKESSPFADLQEQMTIREAASSTDNTLSPLEKPRPGVFKMVLMGGAIVWFVLLVADMFPAVGLPSPFIPDATCLCTSPALAISLLVAYFIEQNARRKAK